MSHPIDRGVTEVPTHGNIDVQPNGEPYRTGRSASVDGSADALAMMERNTHDLSTHWTEGVAGTVDRNVHETVIEVQKNVEWAAAAIRHGENAAHQALNDNRIYPEGRREIAAKARAEAQNRSADYLNKAEVGLLITQAQLESDAMPKMRKGEEQTARMDFQMTLNGKGDLIEKIKWLATDPGSVGSLAVDQAFMTRALAAHGVEARDIDTYVKAARAYAVQAALNGSGNEKRQTAARLLAAAKKNLQGAITSAHSMRNAVRRGF